MKIKYVQNRGRNSLFSSLLGWKPGLVWFPIPRKSFHNANVTLKNLAVALRKGKLPRSPENVLTFQWPFHSALQLKLQLSLRLSSYLLCWPWKWRLAIPVLFLLWAQGQILCKKEQRLSATSQDKIRKTCCVWGLQSPHNPAFCFLLFFLWAWMKPNTDVHSGYQYTWKGWIQGCAGLLLLT